MLLSLLKPNFGAKLCNITPFCQISTAKMPGKRKSAEDTGSQDKKQKSDKKNKIDTQWTEIEWNSNAKTPGDTKWNYKISSWNVDGLRACCTKGKIKMCPVHVCIYAVI